MAVFLLYGCNSNNEKYGDYPYQPVEFVNVKISDQFWLQRLDTNRKVTIPFDLRKCEETGRIDNFAIAGGLKEGSFKGRRYNDSDVFKVLEGASYSLHTYPDKNLEQYLDSVISLIAAAQENDGYLYTCRTIDPDSLPDAAGEERWSYLKSSHELYNIGHMYEAAVAHYRATGKRNFLDVAIKSADLVCKTFGPGENQLHGVPGHQEIEIGLVKLYRVTNDEKYLEMAKYFLNQRGNAEGHELYTYGANGGNKVYTQDHLPVTKQKQALGHAVRAVYMYSGMADVAALTEDSDYIKAMNHLWNNVLTKKLYITGGIGSKHNGEAFGENYELPNLTAYCETCAAIANMLWNQRLFLLHGDAKYIDVLERTLYNNFLAGISVHGDKFFYPNPLESDGSHKRSPWFNCACCPTNVVRFLPSLPGYVYAKSKNDVFVNLFIGSKTEITMPFGKILLTQTTDYPWGGNMKITLSEIPQQEEFSINVRIPGWARNEVLPGDLYRFINKSGESPEIKINGKIIDYKIKNGYARLNKYWHEGDQIELYLPMPVRKIISHDSVKSNNGKLCVQKGPLVYAAEGTDNQGKVRNLLFDMNEDFKSDHKKNLIDGITTLTTNAYALNTDMLGDVKKTPKEVTLIPYYAWAHRGPGEMLIWFPFEMESANPKPPPTVASKSSVSASYLHDNIKAINDQVLPENSNDHSIPRFTFWDHKGTREWVMYDFEEPEVISRTSVFWFDDGPNGGCRIPASWKMLYKNPETGNWEETDTYTDYPVKKDEFNTVAFIPVLTNAVKLIVQLKDNYSGGILEWNIQ